MAIWRVSMVISTCCFVMSFKSLVCAVSEQRQEIKQAIALFPYFDTWNSDTIAECCRVSSLSDFPPDTVILGPGVGDYHTVYFILNGVCRIVQHLYVEVANDFREGRIYKLHALTDSRTSNYEKLQKCYVSKLFNQIQNLNDEEKGTNMCPLKAEEVEKNIDNQSREGISGDETAEEARTEEALFARDEDPEKKIIFESDRHVKVLEECKKKREEVTCSLEQRTPREKPAIVRSLFIETGILCKGASFGLGKLGRENIIMSWRRVKILKIPLEFLLQHNPCNIWNRISLFHSLYLFEDDEIFEHFKNARIWTEKKKKLTEKIVSLKNIPNYTLISDVPYWIRLSCTR